ncbi:MAG: hypothetical protein PHY02_09725 [Phycisphaerae bacterium]|nr:hypothetical protein [Phycisphaerae bacterium]
MIAELTEKQQAQKFIDRYKDDPIGFQVDCLDVKPEHIWPKMVEMAESVRDYQKTDIEAGHSVSKDYEAARLALWFLYTHKPSTVIITGPGNNQVENVFWKEIHTAYTDAKIPLGGHLTQLKLDIDPDRKWFMIGFTTDPDVVTGEATRFQGFHNKYVLVIFTEAAGIKAAVWKAAESLIIGEGCRWLVYGNPTSATGSFAECEKDPTWHYINISVKDTPNFKEDRDIIPGVSGRTYEEIIRLKYGEESNEYAIRVLGRKPEFTQGTYLGRGLAKAETDKRIGMTNLYDPTSPVYTFSDIGDMYSAFGFVQFIQSNIRIIDFYYDCEGKGLPAYSVMLQEKKYRYGGHYSLPDIFKEGPNQKSSHTGQYTVDVARSLGIDFKKIDLPSRNDCIRAAQDIMGKCQFDINAQECVDGLLDWRQRKNEAASTPDKPVYFEEAVKSWGRHVGDMFCGIAVAYRYMSFTGQKPGKISMTLPAENKSPYNDRVLRHGFRRTA